MTRRHCIAVVVVLNVFWNGWSVSPVSAQMETLPQRVPAYGTPAKETPANTALPVSTALPASTVPPTGLPSPYDIALPGVSVTSLPSVDPNASNPVKPKLLEQGAGFIEAGDSWGWHVLPEGLMYRSYMAGRLEPRIGSDIVYQRGHGWYWDGQVGGRAGIVRYGDDSPLNPQGWQFDVEGAAFPRLDLQSEEDLTCADFRAGFLLTNRTGIIETKFGFYHISSHLGDEYMLNNFTTFRRINYVRESLVAGLSIHPLDWLRLYGETGWTFQEDGGAQPWEFQFGFEAAASGPTGPGGTPFMAVNAHLRQENNFGGNVNTQLGWLWRGRTGQTFRLGLQYFSGMSESYQFYDKYEDQIGVGLWYDF